MSYFRLSTDAEDKLQLLTNAEDKLQLLTDAEKKTRRFWQTRVWFVTWLKKMRKTSANKNKQNSKVSDGDESDYNYCLAETKRE